MAVLKLTNVQKECIWQGEYWGSKGVLPSLRSAYEQPDKSFVSMVTMMSVEYSAANRALANLRKGTWIERLEAPLRFCDSFVLAQAEVLR